MIKKLPADIHHKPKEQKMTDMQAYETDFNNYLLKYKYSPKRIHLYIKDFRNIMYNKTGVTEKDIDSYVQNRSHVRKRISIVRKYLKTKNLYYNKDAFYNKPQGLTIDKAVKEYIFEHKRKNMSNRTLKSIYHSFKLFENFLKQNRITVINNVTKKILNDFKLYLYSYKKKNNKSLEVSTQALILVKVQRLFLFLLREGYITYNPALFLRLPRLNKKISRKVFGINEIERFFENTNTNTLTGERNRTVFEVFYSCGLRISELINLEAKNINLEDETVLIKNGKGGTDRVSVLTKTAARYLKKYINEVREKIFSGKTELLFVTSKGKKLDEKYLHSRVDAICRKAEIKKQIDIHSFRRSLATHLLEKGADVRYVQRILGHKSINSTKKYIKITTKDLCKAIEKYHPRGKEEKKVRFICREGKYDVYRRNVLKETKN